MRVLRVKRIYVASANTQIQIHSTSVDDRAPAPFGFDCTDYTSDWVWLYLMHGCTARFQLNPMRAAIPAVNKRVHTHTHVRQHPPSHPHRRFSTRASACVHIDPLEKRATAKEGESYMHVGGHGTSVVLSMLWGLARVRACLRVTYVQRGAKVMCLGNDRIGSSFMFARICVIRGYMVFCNICVNINREQQLCCCFVYI